MQSFVKALIASLLSTSFTQGLPQASPNPANDIPDAQSTICGDLIAWVDQGYDTFPAEFVYECLKSVPFHAAVAVRYLDFYSTLLSFQSTVPYLANPPAGYQQPAVDIVAEIERLKTQAQAGYFRNQYEFEADFMNSVVYAAHDGHIDINSGVLSAFSFASPFEVSSVSSDGVEAPKLYITDDVLQNGLGWAVSPITHINGEDAAAYLARFASLNSQGTLEPHADWNQLMTTPVLSILGRPSIFTGGATFYPGADLTFTFENGTSTDTQWIAYYQEVQATGPLSTGEDFYNFFVLGHLPASCSAEGICPPNPPPAELSATQKKIRRVKRQEPAPSTTPTPIPEPTPVQKTNWFQDSRGAYPANVVVAQKDLSVTGGGVVTGYIFDDISTGVLSLPSFDQLAEEINDFAVAVETFITAAMDTQVSKIIIDLQGNTGGTPLLAFDTFKRFFPTIEPFAGSKRRMEEFADVLGNAVSNYWSALAVDDAEKAFTAGNEWVIPIRKNANSDQLFSSWPEYAGGRLFENTWKTSKVEQYNLQDRVFSSIAFDGYYIDNTQYRAQPTWAAENIVLLTDGLCQSSCVLFVEMMTHQAGVKTIVMGGQPQPGPMQAASGSRGARIYSGSDLWNDINYASVRNATAASILPQELDTGIFTTYAGFNLRDQIRENDEIPLQFQYLAADCRMYYTLGNAFNMTQLWRDAYLTAFTNASQCVTNSTGYDVPFDAKPAEIEQVLPAPIPPQTTLNYKGYAWANGIHFEIADNGGIRATGDGRTLITFSECGPLCQAQGGRCVSQRIVCSEDASTQHTISYCQPPCAVVNGVKGCVSDATCRPGATLAESAFSKRAAEWEDEEFDYFYEEEGVEAQSLPHLEARQRFPVFKPYGTPKVKPPNQGLQAPAPAVPAPQLPRPNQPQPQSPTQPQGQVSRTDQGPPPGVNQQQWKKKQENTYGGHCIPNRLSVLQSIPSLARCTLIDSQQGTPGLKM